MQIRSMVAGQFYPKDPKVLRASVKEMLNDASDCSGLKVPKALIAPHAGYIYSGPVASFAYACLTKVKEKIARVIIFAPAHQYLVDGIATTAANTYKTPLGQIKIDQQVIEKLSFPFLSVTEEAFVGEHSIEVHLPFLQIILGKFLLVPFLVGKSSGTQVKELLEKLWGGSETLIIISSDLSHYHSYNKAKILDGKTAKAIEQLNSSAIATNSACGAIAIRGLLEIAAEKKMIVKQVDLRNSGDTSGDKTRVVGYSAFHLN